MRSKGPSLDPSAIGIRLTWAARMWLAGTFAVIVGFLLLHAAQGNFMSLGSVRISAVNLGELGAACLIASTGYVLRKRIGIGWKGDLESWLWAHICLGILGMMFIWFHSRQRFSQGELLANSAMVLMIATVAGGLLGRVMYVLVPRFLQQLSDYDPPVILEQRINAIDREIASLLAFKSPRFRELHGALLRQLATSANSTEIDRTGLPPTEDDAFHRLTALLAQRAAVAQTRAQRLRYREILDGWWHVHAWLSEAAWILAILHILTSIFIDRKLM